MESGPSRMSAEECLTGKASVHLATESQIGRMRSINRGVLHSGSRKESMSLTTKTTKAFGLHLAWTTTLLKCKPRSEIVHLGKSNKLPSPHLTDEAAH